MIKIAARVFETPALSVRHFRHRTTLFEVIIEYENLRLKCHSEVEKLRKWQYYLAYHFWKSEFKKCFQDWFSLIFSKFRITCLIRSLRSKNKAVLSLALLSMAQLFWKSNMFLRFQTMIFKTVQKSIQIINVFGLVF